MIRRLARGCLTLFALASLAFTGWTVWVIAHTPALTPFVDRGAAEISAAMDRAMAREATADRVNARLADLLAEDPRNWVAIDAVVDVAGERGLPMDPAPITAARDMDFSLTARMATCAACAWNIRECRLSAELACQAPMLLTGLGDITELAREGMNYAAGREVDDLNIALAAVGLGATVFVIASGGTTVGLKAGAGLVKTARGMRLLSPRLTATLTRAAREGVDWATLPAVRTQADLTRALRPAVLAPVADTARAVGRIEGALPPVQTLHLLRHVDDATDARRIANAAEALGPRTVGRMEILSKSRFLRATVRLSRTGAGLLAGILGLILSLAGLAAQMGQTIALRRLRALAR
ncbi:hypothetical protein [Falsirhodobacter halotolerans]|uniref:hypothetical protein n=1 Tax=Falsirhodobacter halotolerans TaxID=1146892 RepID=UPI001FD2D947|nr:hypothetical protein [Falsirhodobacter halotolerans]MCJ8138679.1 hypothetical protein [Falsirhodobacter halotolerans]